MSRQKPNSHTVGIFPNKSLSYSIFNRLHKILEIISINELKSVFKVSINFFTFDSSRHSQFMKAFIKCWKTLNFTGDFNENNKVDSNRSELNYKCCSFSQSQKYCEILCTQRPEKNIRFCLDEIHYTTLLCNIFINTNWRTEVNSSYDIPPTIHRGIKLLGKEKLLIFFPNLVLDNETDTYPEFLEYAISCQRMQYYKDCLRMGSNIKLFSNTRKKKKTKKKKNFVYFF